MLGQLDVCSGSWHGSFIYFKTESLLACAHQWHMIKEKIGQTGAEKIEEPKSNITCLSFVLKVTFENQTWDSKIVFSKFSE